MKLHYALLTLLAVSNYVYAEDLQYNSQEALQEKVWYQAEYQARNCMNTFATSLLAHGMRDQEQLVEALTKTCGSGFRATIAAYKIPVGNLVDPYLEAMAYDELLKIPGLKLASNQTKKATNQTYAGTNGVNRKPMGDTDKIGD